MATRILPRTLESSQPFAPGTQGAEQEVAMAAVVFERLQQAGYIPEDALLATRLPGAPPGFRGETYEARLVEVITDADQDGHLDLDVDRLLAADIVEGPQENVFAALLPGAPSPGLADSMLQRQAWVSQLYGERGARVGRYARELLLHGPERAAMEDVLRSVPARVAAGEAEGAAAEALELAGRLAGEGRPALAAELLLRAADALGDAGAVATGGRVHAELRDGPLGQQPVNAFAAHLDGAGGVRPLRAPNATVDLDPRRLETTHGALAQLRLDQAAFAGSMERELSRPADPRAQADVRAYLARLAETSSTEEVAAELGVYLGAFYVHSGDGVKWAGIEPDQRPARLDELFAALPTDGAGRRIIDCQGFMYLAGGLLPERFRPVYASDDTHVIAGVVDQESGRAFAVNNDQVRMLGGPFASPVALAGAIAAELGGAYYDTLRVGLTPGEVEIGRPDAEPRIGDLIYVPGQGLVGTVTEETLAAFHARQNEAHYTLSFSAFLKELVEGQPAPPARELGR